MKYCKSLTNYERIETSEVQIGDIPIGKNNPIRLQSMTNTNTQDIEKTFLQSKKIIDEGADYIRITTPTLKDVEAIEKIKQKLKEKKINNPIIADIHYNAKIAFAAAEKIEKIRINPGNFAFSTNHQKDELQTIRDNFIPLLETCKRNNTAIRIGTNHGSLSKRIIEKYGDTPEGMVEATLEFLRICKEENFKNIVISLKSSNTVIMVQACRLLVERMNIENMNFPLHLGVTEAGDGEDGRVKSAIGIGALLTDGIGDTIRVSLSEAPEKEIPVSKKIIEYAIERKTKNKLPEIKNNFFDPFNSLRRKTFAVKNIGKNNVPIIISDAENLENLDKTNYPDYIFNKNNINDIYNDFQYYITYYKNWNFNQNTFPLFLFDEYISSDKKSPELNFVKINYADILNPDFEKINNNPTIVLITDYKSDNFIGETRMILSNLSTKKSQNPLVINYTNSEKDFTDFQLKTSVELSTFLIDKLIDGIFIKNKKIEKSEIIKTSFSILQASRLRISKTEYISCPTCGRTLFNIEETISKIKKETSHLKGLKIAIMGCIVNGQGEMADADYGYVGAGEGKITLYKNKEIIKKNISEEYAVDELIKILKENNHWKEKE